jgi:hypothetical protein
MPPVVKKPCVNNTVFSYSGKECSPLGKGYAADAEQVGTIMEGRDTSMWMVGIKNGVKVWNRVPTDLADDTAFIADLTNTADNVPSPKKGKAAPVKKKAPAKKDDKKKKPVVEVSESEGESEDEKIVEKKIDESKNKSDDESEDESEDDAPLSPIKEEPAKKAAPVKKKAVPKKKTVDEGNDDKGDVKPTKSSDEKEKKKRQPTDFNNFMSYQIKIIGDENPGMSHKDKFSKAASQWKQLSDEDKKAMLVKAKAAAEK